jgi:hypothetical protein
LIIIGGKCIMSRTQVVDKGSKTEEVNKGKKGDIVVCVDTMGYRDLTLFGEYVLISDNDGGALPWKLVNDDNSEEWYYEGQFKLKEQSKEVVDLQFPHTVYVRFNGYGKEYAYLCDEETASKYTIWSNAAYSSATFRVKVKTPDGSIKLVDVIRIDHNIKHPNATKCIVLEDSKANVECTHGFKIPVENSAWDRLGDMNIFRSSVPVQFSDGTNSVNKMYPKYMQEEAEIKLKLKMLENLIKQQEEVNMSTQVRRMAKVILIDEDKGLHTKHSLVANFGEILTDLQEQALIRKVIMDNDLKSILAKHNETRIEQTDLEVLQRTGNVVSLREVELENLTWRVTYS